LNNRFILSPYFFEEELPQLAQMHGDGWIMNRPLPKEPGRKPSLSLIHRSLAQHVHSAYQREERPVSIGGDCCSTIAVLAGLGKAGVNPCLIWLDAHGDFNTWDTTPSGFLGGMPLAMIVGRGEQTLVRSVGLANLPEEQVYLADARDLDPGEREQVAESVVHHLVEVTDLLEERLPDAPLYVHFDVDVLDPKIAPAVSYPAPGGPSVEQMEEVFRNLAETGRVIAASLSSWNPVLDHDGRTKEVCMRLFLTLLGLDG
jgi:arginase